MNPTVARLTYSTLLGRRRTIVLLLLPAAIVGVCVLARLLAGLDGSVEENLTDTVASDLLAGFGIGILMPLLGLIAGTGAIGPEIDEGSIIYVLSKPLNRFSIILTKLAVAISVVIVFGVLPVALSGVILTGELGRVTLSYTVGALVGGIAYCALFLLLAVMTRNAVVVGLIYALVWESLVGQFVPGAQTLSVQQWSLAAVVELLGDRATWVGLDAAVGVVTGLVLLALVTVTCTGYAGVRLRSLRMNAEV